MNIILSFQNIMVFKKMSINGKGYGDCVDEFENPIEITEVLKPLTYQACSMTLFSDILDFGAKMSILVM